MNKVLFNKFNLIVTGVVAMAVVGVLGIATQQKPAEAAGALPNYSCDVSVVDGPANKALKVSADKKTVSATVIVSGSMANCDRYATISVWKSNTASGQPLNQQTFFGKDTVKLVPGRNTLTAQLPQCGYWQADLLGQKRPKSVFGDANYQPYVNDQTPYDILVNYKLGGEPCTPPTPNDVCPNIDGMQTQVPDGYVKDANGNCVITPTTPTTPDGGGANSTTGQPEAIPNTGAGALTAIASGVTAFGSGVAHFVIRRRKLV